MSPDPQLGVIREAYGRLVFTHKTHEKERERLSKFGIASRWVNIGLSALTFGGIAAVLGTGSFAWTLASAILAVTSAGFAIFQLSFDPARSAENQRSAAKRFLELRNLYELLIADIMGEAIQSQEVRRRRDQLSEWAAEAYRSAPNTSHAAYLSAQDALGKKDEMTFTEGEIDSFLPRGLRLNPGDDSAE